MYYFTIAGVQIQAPHTGDNTGAMRYRIDNRAEAWMPNHDRIRVSPCKR
jgi:hypothetical protein